MDSAHQWPQEFGVGKSMAEVAAASNACTRSTMERKVRPQKDQAINCPRCQSTNTKFCYYNNYSLTQPRYFCKTCRRYWTEGGTLRNVPVGGGSRKNKKSTSNTASSPSLSMVTSPPVSSSHRLPDLNPPPSNNNISHFSSQNPKNFPDQGQDLNLGFQVPQEYHHHGGVPQFLDFPKIQNRSDAVNPSSNPSSTSAPISALNFLRNGIAAPPRGLNSFIPMTSSTIEAHGGGYFASSGFPFQECKPPSFAFSVDGRINGNHRYANPNHHEVRHDQDDHNVNGSLMFTLGAANNKQHSSTSEVADQSNKGQENSNGFWNGMLGGGSW